MACIDPERREVIMHQGEGIWVLRQILQMLARTYSTGEVVSSWTVVLADGTHSPIATESIVSLTPDDAQFLKSLGIAV